MKIIRLLCAGVLTYPFLASAGSAAAPPMGHWALPAGVTCAMTFEITPDGHIVRTTGELVYTTTASLTRDGKGWLLDEQLQDHNGRPSCRGDQADQVVEHLKNKAYIEVRGKTLRYRSSKDSGRVLSFVRSGA